MRRISIFICLLGMLQPGSMQGQVSWPGSVSRRLVSDKDLITGAGRTGEYLPLLSGKGVAVMANHTSRIGKTHLIDSLLALKVNILKVFTPEHGFRGDAGAGEYIENETDAKTGLPLVSLYGNKKKPGREDLKGVDIVLFDLQDVGVRFYTYAASMQYLMEACAEMSIPLVVLDRPNPNGHYIDGPVLERKRASFVGLNPVPLVHGLSLGEYALMINGEGWLKKGKRCELKVVPVYNYHHNYLYQLPLPPSPNLPNMAAVYLYPSLGLFEGTAVSVGRGTAKPFQVIGFPGLADGGCSFTPRTMPGFSLDPPYRDQLCQGFDLQEFSENFVRDSGKLFLYWMIELYKQYPDKKKFFNGFFDTLAGESTLREQVKLGLSEEQIRASWAPALSKYKKTRLKYLLYPDFE